MEYAAHCAWDMGSMTLRFGHAEDILVFRRGVAVARPESLQEIGLQALAVASERQKRWISLHGKKTNSSFSRPRS